LSTKNFYPITAMPSVQIPTRKSTKDLTQIPLTTDLGGYFDGLNVNYGIRRTANSSQLITTPSISNKKSKDKNEFFVFFESFFCIDYSPCLSTPCLHNSTCVVQSEHRFQCICSPAFIGIYCEVGKLLRLFPNISSNFSNPIQKY